MYAAIGIFHCLLLRVMIEGILRRDFDLDGGPKEYYAPVVNEGTDVFAAKCNKHS